MSLGKISKHEFANRCAQDLIVVGWSIGMGVAGAAIAAAMFTPAAAVYGYIREFYWLCCWGFRTPGRTLLCYGFLHRKWKYVLQFSRAKL